MMIAMESSKHDVDDSIYVCSEQIPLPSCYGMGVLSFDKLGGKDW
jgi:hypothetical protein